MKRFHWLDCIDTHITHIRMCCFYEIQIQLTKAETKFGSIEHRKLNNSSTNLGGDVLVRKRRDGGNIEGVPTGKKE